MAPRETENNAYAKFWGDKQRTLWYVMVFSGVVNCSDRPKNPALLSLPINLSANPKRRNLHTFSRAFLQTSISFEFDWLIGLSLSVPIG